MELSELAVSLFIQKCRLHSNDNSSKYFKRMKMNYKELGTVNIEDIENGNIILMENQYLLKVDGQMGFMVKLNKDGTIPKAFKDWGDMTRLIYVKWFI